MQELLERLLKPNQLVYGLTNSAKSYLLAKLLRESKQHIIFVVANHHDAQTYTREIQNLSQASTSRVYNFLCQEVSPYDQINSDLDIVSKQYEIFKSWQEEQSSLTIIPFKAFAQLYISPETLRKRSLIINQQLEINTLDLARQLVKLGYYKESIVESRGQFSIRGDLIDIYPLSGEPIRLELFGESIESLRTFSTASQRSIKNINEVLIEPRYSIERSPDDALEARIKNIVTSYSKSLSPEARESLELLLSSDIENSAENLYWEGVEYFSPLLEDQSTDTLFRHLPASPQFIFDEWQDLLNGALRWEEQILSQYRDNIKSGKIIPISEISPEQKCNLHVAFNQITNTFKQEKSRLYLQTLPEEGSEGATEIISYPAERFASKIEDFIEYLRKYIREGLQVVIFSEQPQRVLGILKEWDINALYQNNVFETPSVKQGNKLPVWVLRDGTDEGFRLPDYKLLVLTDRELFGRSRQAVARQKRNREDDKRPDIYSSISELKHGDYVVHYKHGVGIYRGTEFVELDKGLFRQEYLIIEYAAEARVLIPVDQVKLLSRFNTTEDSKPRLSKLGGTEWERTKTKVKKSVRKIAQDLINLYAARAKQSGYIYPPDTPWQIEMEDAFPYTETSDQLKAIQEVKQDMESNKLMDRLICGDAGFGKTEVIIRAVFKAIMDAKQVAILVPTTVLAQQHYNVFRDRYAPYPIKTGLLCRFRTAREQKETVDKLKIGECDLVIGTHRLLQKDIQFKNLGLLVIDEEQRFGVAHKEKLKAMRKDLDIISMSATPIPRTLHMSISGIKDISLISTAPINRLPVKTYVGEYKNSVIRTAILHELERGGQIFFVHNRIENIDAVAISIQELVPEASVRVAHGKMAEGELEDVMFAFVNHEFDILISTTIIETGLDIPNANTIIINDANAFGLSQLYQLRGRVGRSDVQAYAYLMYRPEADISDTARQRLKAIRELTNLGAGYQVAMRDMEIRGVGNVFGAEQHGQMLSVGFDLYCKILSDTIEEMKGKLNIDDLEKEVSIDIKISAFFPENWLSDPKQRMNEYRRLSMISEEKSLENLISEWQDRFGKLPLETCNLIEILRIKLLAKAAKISTISQEGDSIKIYNDMRLGKWISLQRSLKPDLQSRTSFKAGTYGSRTQESYINIKISYLDNEAILDAIREVVLKLKESHEASH